MNSRIIQDKWDNNFNRVKISPTPIDRKFREVQSLFPELLNSVYFSFLKREKLKAILRSFKKIVFATFNYVNEFPGKINEFKNRISGRTSSMLRGENKVYELAPENYPLLKIKSKQENQPQFLSMEAKNKSTSVLRKTVLITDSDPINAMKMVQILKIKGIPYVLAKDYKDLHSKLNNKNIGMVLIAMYPTEKEEEFYYNREKINAIKQSVKKEYNLPVIAVTNILHKYEKSMCLQNGFDRVLVRPFLDNDFLSVITGYLNVSNKPQ